MRISLLLPFLALLPSLAQAGQCSKPTQVEFLDGLSASVWTPKREQHKNVIVLPSTADKTLLDEILSRKLCRRGIRSIVLNKWHMDNLGVEQLEFYDRLVARALNFVAEAKSRYPGKYGIAGSSLGAIIASTVRGIDRTIGPMVLYVGGVDIPWLLAWNQSRKFVGIREAQMSFNNIGTQAEYEGVLRTIVKSDPADVADPSARRSVRIFGSELDTVIAPAKQIELWEAWGKPLRISFYLDHEPAIIVAALLFSASNANFMARKLCAK